MGTHTESRAMIRVIRVCRKCGAKIFSDAPRWLCTACVLETALGISPNPVAADQDEAANPRTGESARSPSHRFSDSSLRSVPVLGALGDYELLEEVGRGGQGVVFRARQKSLNRIVALKVISLGQWASKAHLKRFRREAEAAASLDHPGIVPVYEVDERDGSCFFSMKFIDGGQLDEVVRRRPPSIRQAAGLIAQVARTVHYAHEHGILHRDIKPGNILLDANGEPHLTDFGLARLLESQSTITRTLEVMGTPSYMAPEQAVGETAKLTSATDVYALGAVLYQLVTSHPPFAGGTTYETIKLLLDSEPRQPRLLNAKVDRDLSTICLKCLEKDPARRYSSALALAEDLERWLKHEPICARRTGLFNRAKKWVQRNPAIASLVMLSFAFAVGLGGLLWKNELAGRPLPRGIAVLPFENLGDKENAFFADGVQDDILTKLAKIGHLKVISRTSVMPYRGARNTRHIGNALGVSHVLEGSVQRAGNKVHVNAQLIDTRTDTHVWAEEYDRDFEDVFSIQNEISRRVVDALKIQLGAQAAQRLVKKPTENAEAYDAYLLGRFELNKFTENGFRNSLAHFQKAIALDPKFALAYTGLAEAYNTIGYWGYLTPKEAFPEAKEAAQTALKIDADLAEAHGALAYTEFQYEWKFKEAEAEFKEAIRLNPNSASARLRFSEYLFDLQRAREAHEQFERAKELDPLSVQISLLSAVELFFSRDFDRALDQLEKTISMDPNNALAFGLQGAIFYHKKMPAQAFSASEKANGLEGVFSREEMAEMRKVYETAGLSAFFRKENEFRQRRIAEGKYESSLGIALNYVRAGDYPETLYWLEKAVEEHTPWLPELKTDPTWDPIRSQPRFIALLKKIGLE
jgi:eukaryotic-like serine/threonine-protein kinase